jgi:hypothetical protein
MRTTTGTAFVVGVLPGITSDLTLDAAGQGAPRPELAPV